MSFKRYNLIFAENGRGKTTLCSVLRSLQTGNHEYITERITIPSNFRVPEVVIGFDTENIVFRNQSWTKTIPEIVIFDSTFIAQNIYSGESVTGSHRTNLLQVIVGEIGVSLMRVIKELTESIDRKNFELKEIEERIDLDFRRHESVKGFKDFVELDNISDIDGKIAEREMEINAFENLEKIMTQPELARITVPTLPSDFDTVIAKTPDDISLDAEAKLMEQLNRHGMDEGDQAWILKGLDWIHDDCCPFCGQGIKGLSLVSFYKRLFSASYRGLVDEMDSLQQKITDEVGEKALGKFGMVFANNKNTLQFWKPIVPMELTEVDYDMLIVEPIRVLREAAFSLINRKRKSPLSVVSLGSEFREANLKYSAVIADMKVYNDQIATANTIIKNRKEKVKTMNNITILQEIVDLRLVKLRYTSLVNQLCSNYKDVLSEKNTLEEKKEAAKADLSEHRAMIINSYQETINKFLKGFGADFSITNSKQEHGRNVPTASYQILINEHPVDLGSDSSSIGKPCFRTALSAGDRSTLAFAFFLAQLDHNPKKKDCVVVFDDPVSSLDDYRQEHTAELLKKCGEESAQLLVFSHDARFLNLVYSKLPSDADPHFLQLSRASNNTTLIEKWNIEKEIQSSYFKDHAILESYWTNGAMGRELTDIARRIRPVLEDYLRYRLPNQFAPNHGLGRMIEKLKKWPKGSALHSMFDELTKLNNFSRRYHHRDSEKTGGKRLTDSELRGHVRRVLDITCS